MQHTKRLIEICRALRLPQADYMKSKLFFEGILNKELEFRLFNYRNVDVLMVCCLFCALRSSSERAFTFQEIFDAYKKQPQFVENVKNIFLT